MTCKDCIHCEACERMISDTSKMFKVLLSEILKMNCDIKYDSTNILSGAEICQCFQDRARFVELPCKVGDEVYFIFTSTDGTKRINPVKVCNYTITTEMMKIHTSFGYFTEHDLNKDVFLTREEAEQALKERENDE